MYISKISFPLDKVKILGYPYRLHQELFNFFDSEQRDFIHYVPTEGPPCVYVISKSAPDDRKNEGFTVLTKPYSPNIEVGDVLRISVKISRVSRNRGKETSIKSPDKIRDHVISKMTCAGNILDFSIEEIGYDKAGKKGINIGIAYAEVTMKAEITDTASLHTMMAEGVGRKKALGLGMLRIQRDT